MKGNLRPYNILMLHNMRLRKFQINQKLLRNLQLVSFSDFDETEKESKENNYNDIDYDQVPLTSKFNIIIC